LLHYSNNCDFKVTKLLFDSGANLNFKTFWSINANELVVGQGDIEGNAIQLLQFIKEHHLFDKLQMSAEHFDKVLQHFGVEVFLNILCNYIDNFLSD
jgi:hypothetical protein